MKKLVIGIDPGQQTGVAYALNGVIKAHDTLDFYACIQKMFEIRGYKSEYDKIIVFMEDPNLNKPTFLPKDMKADIFRRPSPCLDGKPLESQDSSLRIAMRKAQNVGMNKKEASLMMTFLQKMGFEVRTIRPQSKKLSADEVQRLTGYTKSTNQHTRDAIMLILGR